MQIGIDEVGRGAWAGPMVMAAVGIDKEDLFVKEPILTKKNGGQVVMYRWQIPGESWYIGDSKQLSPQIRQRAKEWIIRSASVEVIELSAAEINKFGLSYCWHQGLDLLLDRVYSDGKERFDCTVDGNWITEKARHLEVRTLIRGDGLNFAVACASIVAKVYRDEIMTKKSSLYSYYGWDSNKGYGTRAHQKSIGSYGICCEHRESWVSKYVK